MPDIATLSTPAASVVLGATVFTVMLALGLTLKVEGVEQAFARPALLGRGVISVLVVVPIAGVVVGRVLHLPREAEVGIALMAASPGAPIALRRSIGAGGHQSFAAVLQLLVAALAIVSMPLSIAALNAIYGTQGVLSPMQVARQVFVAQLFPIGLGLVVRRMAPVFAVRSEPLVRRVAAVLLIVSAALVFLVLVRTAMTATAGTGPAVVLVTLIALAVGHGLGGPWPDTRTAVAVLSALRNPGLALLVVSSNRAPIQVVQAVLAYILWTTVVVTAYVFWRRRRQSRST